MPYIGNHSSQELALCVCACTAALKALSPESVHHKARFAQQKGPEHCATLCWLHGIAEQSYLKLLVGSAVV